MRIEIVHTTTVEEVRRYTLAEVAEGSGLTEIELRELAETGVLEPLEHSGGQWIFSGRSLWLARTARRLRIDFELDASGVALAVQLIGRIRELEDEIRLAQARTPKGPY
jgi:chaperone modulatory protein CbpM